MFEKEERNSMTNKGKIRLSVEHIPAIKKICVN
jgi:hypothetical protein